MRTGRPQILVTLHQILKPFLCHLTQVRAELADGKRDIIHVGSDQIDNCFPIEGGLPGQGMVNNMAERIEIGAGIDRVTRQLFRSHIVDRSH